MNEKRKTKKQITFEERENAMEFLREHCPPGTTVYTILRHVSRSGMHRVIDLLVVINGEMQSITWYVSRVTSMRVNTRNNGYGLAIGGCGMDMGFHAVYNLSSVLYPTGFGCIGKRCPSNDHSNGDRSYAKNRKGRKNHWHSSGGYALIQRWM